MNIDVYDTYAQSENGQLIHFDVFVKQGTSKELASEYAQNFLKTIGSTDQSLTLTRCNYCHVEQASPKVQQAINDNNHYILQLEGCPTPDL